MRLLCDRCGLEEDFKDWPPLGWARLETCILDVLLDLTFDDLHDLCPACVKRAIEKTDEYAKILESPPVGERGNQAR